MNCKKYRNKAKKQKETWLKNLPKEIIYFHVIGEPEIQEEYIISEENNLLVIKTEDTYESLPKKVIMSFEIINKLYDYTYIFKTDDDQMYVESYNFFELLIEKLNNNCFHYGGKVTDIKTPTLCKYFLYHPELPRDIILRPTQYCNGRFYFLSKECIINLIEEKENIKKEYIEDYAIGQFIPHKYKMIICYIDNDKYFKDMTSFR
jgi:hypothetical protein